VIARYAPWDGLYMFHCHNLIHEDHEMMAAMNVTALSDLGYDEKTSFIDPMEQRYRAKSFSKSDWEGRGGDFTDAAIKEKVAFFNNLDAYRNVVAVESRLEAYWQTASSGSASSATSSTVAAASATTLVTSASASAASSASNASASSSSAPAAIASSNATPSATTTSAPAATVSTTASITTKAATTTKKADDKSTKKTTTTRK